MSCTLSIQHSNGIIDCLVIFPPSLKVFLDGELIGKFSFKKGQRYNIAPGKHQVYLSWAWSLGFNSDSNTIEFSLKKYEDIIIIYSWNRLSGSPIIKPISALGIKQDNTDVPSLDESMKSLREMGFYLPYSKCNKSRETTSTIYEKQSTLNQRKNKLNRVESLLKNDSSHKWLTRPIFSGTAAWDWISLVFTPTIGIAVSAYVAINLFSREIEVNRKNLEDQINHNIEVNRVTLRETREQNSFMLYRQQMQDLILEHGLERADSSEKDFPSREILLARALTSSIIRELRASRNREIVNFLYMSNLIQAGTTALLSDNFLAGADLEEAYLMNVDLSRANMTNAKLKGANLQSSSLSFSQLREANLDNINLSFSDLKNANLEKTELDGAKLIGSDLRNSNLSSASLIGTDFDGANLEGAIIKNVLWGSKTNFFNSRGIHKAIIKWDEISKDFKKDLESSMILSEGIEMATIGDIENSISTFKAVENIDHKRKISVFSWNTLCWFGSIHGKAREVIYACDNALKSIEESKNLSLDTKSRFTKMVKDSRGVARGIIGDNIGAISDLQKGLNTLSIDAQNRRKMWIDLLKRGENPFTSNELLYLRKYESD